MGFNSGFKGLKVNGTLKSMENTEFKKKQNRFNSTAQKPLLHKTAFLTNNSS